MKICLVSAYPPTKGNLAEYAYFLAMELAKDLSIYSLVILADGRNFEIENKGKIKIIRCWKNNSFFIPIKILINVFRENPDIVHFNLHMRSWGSRNIVNFLTHLTPFFVKLLLRKKVIVTLHNIVETANLKEMGIKNNILIILGARLSTRFLLLSDRLVVLLKRYKTILSRNYRKKNILYIPHGTFGRKVRIAKFSRRKILTFGFLSPYKNLPLLVEVFKELKKKYKRLELVIAGDSHPNYPGYLDSLKKKYKFINGLKFLGYIPIRKLSRAFKSSSIVVLPYLTSTGTSGVIHLAVSYGKPIVISKLPDIEATAREEGYQLLLVKKNNKSELKKAIEKLLKNKKLYLKIARSNLEASEKYSFSKVAKMYVNLYKKILSQNEK